MITEQLHKRFLDLVSSAIGIKDPSSTLFHDMGRDEWRAVQRLAGIHGINALIADKIISLPDDLLPPTDLVASLVLQIEKTAEQNTRFNAVLTDVAQGLDNNHIPFILLKGPAVAKNYPQPLLRSVGDLDILVPDPVMFKRAGVWALRHGFQQESKNIHHTTYVKNNIRIEFHKFITYFGNRRQDLAIRKLTENELASPSLESITVGNSSVKIFSATFNAFYIFLHLFNHFVHSGVGMRQICDWLIFLSANREKINKEKFISLSHTFNLIQPIKAFAHVAGKHLNYPQENFPFDPDGSDDLSDELIEDIIKGGNFGRAHLQTQTLNATTGKWSRYKHSLKRAKQFSGVAPEYFNRIAITQWKIYFELLFK